MRFRCPRVRVSFLPTKSQHLGERRLAVPGRRSWSLGFGVPLQQTCLGASRFVLAWPLCASNGGATARGLAAADRRDAERDGHNQRQCAKPGRVATRSGNDRQSAIFRWRIPKLRNPARKPGGFQQSGSGSLYRAGYCHRLRDVDRGSRAHGTGPANRRRCGAETGPQRSRSDRTCRTANSGTERAKGVGQGAGRIAK
jgi:hypothetical protein